MNPSEENILFNNIQKGDEKAFEQLFKTYYSHLCLFSSNIMEDEIVAEEIVQEFFVKLWEKRTKLNIETSLKNYVFRSVKNLCLNQIKHNKIRVKHAKYVISEAEANNFNDNFIEVDLAKRIEESIQTLPEKRREIFRLSREEGLKYREIAEKLKLSIKTVEAQMGLALKTLREKLKDYNTFLFFISVFKIE